MLADFEAEAGSDTALDYIRQLRSYEPGEADAILATLRFRQARFDDAAAALEEAFENFRTDPWALNRFKQRAVGLAGAVATRSPQIAARMFEALSAPLALRALQDERLGVLAALTRRVGFEASCQDAVGALEPQVAVDAHVPDPPARLLPGDGRPPPGRGRARASPVPGARAGSLKAGFESR